MKFQVLRIAVNMANIVSLSTQLAKNLARPELINLQPYESARRISSHGEIWINANESPFNNARLNNLEVTACNRYPDCQPILLKQAYADYVQISHENILITRGADEAIELLIRTFCEPKVDSISIFTPTYGMYEVCAETANVNVQKIALDNDYLLPNKMDIDPHSKIIFICNPNNPTGTRLPQSQIIKLLTENPEKLVVIDEAYIEFCHLASNVNQVINYPNLVILRTLSKAFALAGIRCGFLLANIGIIDMLMKVIAPYPIPEPVAQIAVNALTAQSIHMMQKQVAILIKQGKYLSNKLKNISTVLPTNANFVMAFFDDIQQINTLLQQHGIVARRYHHQRLANAIRFSFSNQQDTEKILQVLQAYSS